MLVAALPPAVVKLPPAYNVLPDTASAYTVAVHPRTEGRPTAPVPLRNVIGRMLPPAAREIAARIQRAARHRQRIHSTLFKLPEPRADQLLPFHCAM